MALKFHKKFIVGFTILFDSGKKQAPAVATSVKYTGKLTEVTYMWSGLII
jgi:hypothetical protein